MANKNSVNVLLNILTAFSNIDLAVNNFKKLLKSLNLSDSLLLDLTKNFLSQVEQIQSTLKKVSSFNFSTGSSKEYASLITLLSNEYNSLNAMVKQYKNTFVTSADTIIQKQLDIVDSITLDIQAKEKLLDVLNLGEDAYNRQASGATDLNEEELKLAQTYSSNIPKILKLTLEINKDKKARAGHKSIITQHSKALTVNNQVLEQEEATLKSSKIAIDSVTTAREKEYEQAKKTEAASKASAKAEQKAQQEQQKAAEAAAKAELKAQQEQQKAAEAAAKAEQKAAEAAAKALQKALLLQQKQAEAAAKEQLRIQQKALQELQKQAEAAAKAAEKELKAKIELLKVSTTFVLDISKLSVESDKLTEAISSLVVKWTSFTAVVNTALRAITDIIQTYQELDDNLSAISAVSGISTQELWGDMPSMIDNANELALTVEDLTNGMLLFYQQGLSAAETEVRLEAAGKMAAISQQDLATAVDQLTSAMNAFNMTGDDAQKVVDVYAALAGATAVDVQELAAAMSRTASIAQNAGLTFEETAAFLTTMEETTRLSAETIGNSFKSIIARFTQLRTSSEALEDGVDANKVETALKTAGVALRDANGEFRNLGNVLMELSSVWDTLDTNTQRYIATTAAGTQQQSNFIALISQYLANMDNLNTAMNSAGAAEQQFLAISENLSSALKRLDNGFTAIKTSWTESINVLTLLVDGLAALLRAVALIPAPIQLITVAFTAMIAKQVAAELLSQKNVAQMFKEAAAQEMLETVQKSSLSTNEKIAVLKELLRAKSKGLTEALVAESLVLKGLTDAEKAQVVAAYSQVTANTAVKLSFDLIKTSALKASAAIKTLATQHPIILAISLAVSAAAAAFSFFQSQAEKAKLKIEDLTTAVEDFNSEAQESLTIADSLDGYISSLKEAHDAGQDLTSIRKEIEKSGYLELSGVDVLTASYGELLSALKEVYAEQEKLASISRGRASLAEMELDVAEGKDALKNTYGGLKGNQSNVGYAYFNQDNQEVDLSKEILPGETNIEAATRLNYVVKYQVTINGQKLIYETQEEAESALQKAIDDFQNPKQNYSTSNATDIVNAIESIDQNFFTSLNLSSEQAQSLIKIWGNLIGGAIYDTEKEEIEPAFKSFISTIGTSLSTNAEQLGATTEDLYNYLSGNFQNLNDKSIMAIRAALNLAIELSEGEEKEQLEQFTENAAENYGEAYNELKAKLLSDYELISDEDAKIIGWDGLTKIEDALEEGGKDFAQAVADILTGDISTALENTDFEGNADLIVNELQDILEDVDTSSLEGLTDVIDRLSSTEYANLPIVQELISYYNLLKGELIDSSSVMEGAYTAAENYTSALTSIANAAAGTSIPLSEVQSIMAAAGLTAADASQYFTWMGDGFLITSDKALQLVNALANTTNATYADAIASQLSAQAKAQAAAQELRGLEQKLRGYALSVTANGQLINADGKLVDAEVVLAEAIDQVAAKSGALGTGVEKLSVATVDTANEITALADQVGLMASEQEAASAAAQANIAILQNMQALAQSAAGSWQNYGDAPKFGGGGGGSSAAEGTNEATEALEAQKEALQESIDKWEDYKSELEDSKLALEDQKDALENLNDRLKDNLELYLDLIKTRLEEEIDRQTTAVEAFYDAIKDVIQNEIDAFNEKLDLLEKKADELQEKADKLQEEAEKQEESLNKLYEAATSYYDAVQAGIENEISLQDDAIEKNEYKISLLENLKDAIQKQIDNLDKAADSESKLLALEKARDALANARNQKTRMVLTNGGGWRLKTDTAAVQEALSNLADAERDYQKELLERQQDKLDEQISELEAENEKIEDIQDSLEEQNDLIDNIKQDWEDAAENLGKTTSEIEELTKLLLMIASATEAERNDLLLGFQSNVAQNNNQFQDASNAANEANQASNEYDYLNNADNLDSIAAAIEALKELQNLTDEALKEYFENLLSNNAEEIAISLQMKDLVGQLIQNGNGSLESFDQFRDLVNGAFDAANEFASNQAAYINKINETIAYYEEWSNRLDLTSQEINDRLLIMNEINNATLSSLLEGGSTFNQLQGQYDEIIRNNDEAVRILGLIDDIDVQIDDVQRQIDDLKKQLDDISKQEQALEKANSNNNIAATKGAGDKVSGQVKASGTGIENSINSMGNKISSSISNIKVMVTPETGGSKYNTSSVSKFATGGLVGFSTGGVDDSTRTVAVHGTKNRPELVLNNSQSAALFKYIDSMTRIPTLSSAGNAKNALLAFNTTNNTTNEGTSFTGCEFNIESNASNLDSLVQELKLSSSIRRK